MSLVSDTAEYVRINHDIITEALLQHARLALVPVVIAVVLALPLGWMIDRFGVARHALLTLGSVVYTIPSLALLLILPGIIGTSVLDPLNVIIALTAYSLALLARTTADAFGSVDEQVLQAASAMGYRSFRQWLTVQLPLALPVMWAGIRVATVANVSMVSIAALVGIGGLGQLFTRGFQLGFYPPPIVIGLVLSVMLAFLADVLIVLAQRLSTPWVRAGASR
ncbi:ABC transporter permease [Nocardioides sp.]|uniref:ABC transporter permease n=1 Tax=Nocardioides sp. TaxID=35761 RepID=UPI0035B2F287